MSPEVYEYGLLFLSSVFCAATVKLLDDYLDREADAAANQPNWISRLGEGAVAYCLPLLAVGIALQPAVSLPLFLASWAVGMYRDLRVKYLSRLSGWQEVVLTIAIGISFAGWRMMLFALLLAFSVQAIDDLIDCHRDCLTGIRNLALRFGKMECILLASICLLGSWLLAGSTFWPVCAGIVFVYAIAGGCRYG